MANKYVDDDGDNADGDTWGTAYQSIFDGLTNVGAGDTLFVASTHSEAVGTSTLASTNGIQASPVTIISTDITDDSYETMAIGGGDISNAGAEDLTINGADIWVGMNFDVADNIQLGNGGTDVTFIDCDIKFDDLLDWGGSASNSFVLLENCRLVLDTAGSITSSGGSCAWRGGSFAFGGAGALTSLFVRGTESGDITLEDVDLSGLANDDFVIAADDIVACRYVLNRCKLPTFTTGGIINAALISAGTSVKAHSCSNSDVVYQFTEYYMEGQIDEDTAVYLDATYDGANGYSAKMVTTGTAKEWVRPLRFKLADIYISATGKTLTVELLTDNVTLQNDEFWLEVEYPDSTIAAFGNILSTRPITIFTAPANLTASAKGAGDWTGESGTPVYQKVVADFTGVADEAIGVYRIWACLAKPSTTVYVDPKIVVA